MTIQVNRSQPTAADNPQMTLQAQPSIDQHKAYQHQQNPLRLKGGGAARDCFIGMVECFICFECCKGCCECCADIICCPCEMCC